MLEQLEDRRLLACEVFVDDKRTLFIRGDAADNTIDVRGDQDRIIVTCDGVPTRVPSGDVDSVQVKGGDGNDTISAAVIAAALHLFGDDGYQYMLPDVDDDGVARPMDSLIGGGGHDTVAINATELADIIRILGTGNQIIPDPEITVNNAAGVELAHLFVQETEGIALNTWAGDDAVEMQNNGLLAGIDWTINTGDGADDVHFAVVPGPTDSSACPAAPERLTVNLGSAPGGGALALDSFFLDARAGWCPADPSSQPATIDILGGQGIQKVKLDFGQIGTPLQQGFSAGAELFAELGAADDLAEMLFAGDIFAPVGLFADMGPGNDHFSQVMQEVRVDAGFMMNLDSGSGDDRAALDISEAACPGDPSLPPGPCQPIDIDMMTGDGRDTVMVTTQDLGVDLHFDADLGNGDDSFTANILPDGRVGPGGGCIELNVSGGRGNDWISLEIGDVNVPPPDRNQPQPTIAAQIMVNFNGGRGDDTMRVLGGFAPTPSTGGWPLALGSTTHILLHDGDGLNHFDNEFTSVEFAGEFDVTNVGGGGADVFTNDYSDV